MMTMALRIKKIITMNHGPKERMRAEFTRSHSYFYTVCPIYQPRRRPPMPITNMT